MKTPVLDAFSKGWIGLFSKSPKARLAWHTLTGLSLRSYLATRWWSKFEVLLNILRDPSQSRKLKMELAVTIDVMEPFVKATYVLEGDGPLAFVAYERLTTLFTVIASEHYPNVNTAAKNLSSGDSRHEHQLVAYAKSYVVPVFTDFKSKFENNLQPAVLAFKAARYFSPPKVNEIKPTAADIDSLRAISFLDTTSTIDGLKAELPLYLAAAEDVSAQTDVLQWWKSHQLELPKWAEACSLVLLMQPSSAAAERVFSILSNSFSSQ